MYIPRILTFEETVEEVMKARGLDRATALQNIARAAREGAIVATRRTSKTRIRHVIPTEDWEDAKLDRLMESPELYKEIWFDRESIESIWYATQPEDQDSTTAAPANACKLWIEQQVATGADWSRRKKDALEECQRQIPQLSERAFKSVWSKHALPAWKRPGPPRSRQK